MTESHVKKYQFAYHSRLAPGNGYTVFGAVCRAARVRNLARGIGGVLLFDGECFFQWVHGPQPAVHALLKAICDDSRHSQLTMLLNGPASPAPPHSHWHAGFVDAAVLESFMGHCAATSVLEPQAMRALFSQADLQPALPCAELAHCANTEPALTITQACEAKASAVCQTPPARHLACAQLRHAAPT